MKLLDGILELVKANIAPSIPCYDLKGQMEIDEEKNKTEDLLVVLQEGLLRSVLLECFTVITLKIFVQYKTVLSYSKILRGDFEI